MEEVISKIEVYVFDGIVLIGVFVVYGNVFVLEWNV